MSGWTPEFEADLSLLLKDWLKQQSEVRFKFRGPARH